jgi:hypothetical protein
MSVKSTKAKEINDLSCELRLELEACFKRQEELLKTFENLSKQPDETKQIQVITFCYIMIIYLFSLLKNSNVKRYVLKEVQRSVMKNYLKPSKTFLNNSPKSKQK